jgi:polysaccharide export outer membrane protein
LPLPSVLAFFVALAAVAACATPTAGFDYSKEPDPRKREFVIGVSDALKITVWKNPELSTDAKVRPDGTITLPLLGDVQAAGRTPGQLKEEIARRLVSYIRDDAATVSVAVTEVNSYRFTVSGNVERGGVFTAKYYVTVAEALALAGGLNRYATADQIVIVRSERGGKTRKVPVNYDEIRTGEHPEENIVILAGDTIFVP